MKKMLCVLVILFIIVLNVGIGLSEGSSNDLDEMMGNINYLEPSTETLLIDEKELTLEKIFEDEAMAMCIRDMLAKFSIKQPVTQEELDTITSIGVYSSKDYGTFTSLKGIGYLRNLKTLGLYNGCCSGISELPEDFFTLSNLNSVDLSRAAIVFIPDDIGKLTSLKYLDIGGTGIKSLPDSIGNLVNLTTLDVSSTGLTTLPNSIANCKALKKLNISYTSITEVPEALYSLNLETLEMKGLSIR